MAKIYGGINHGLWTDNLLDPVQSKLNCKGKYLLSKNSFEIDGP